MHRECRKRAVMLAGIPDSPFLSKSVAGKRSRHSRRIRNLRFYVSGKWPIIHTSMCWSGLYCCSNAKTSHDGVITWNCFVNALPSVWSPVRRETDGFHVFFDVNLTNNWTKSGVVDGLRRHDDNCDAIIMQRPVALKFRKYITHLALVDEIWGMIYILKKIDRALTTGTMECSVSQEPSNISLFFRFMSA